jgi:hypothetical protein
LSPHNLAKEGKKRGNSWVETDLREEAETIDQSREEKRAPISLWFEEELRSNIILGAGSGWRGFPYKLKTRLTSDCESTRAYLLAWYREN